MTNKSIKLFAASALAISALGLSAMSASSIVEAASVTQISGDEAIGEIELVTNAFPTYESAHSFATGEAAKILDGEAYQGETTPELPGTGYVVSIRIQYDALTSKEQAIALANQVVAAADSAIGGTTSVTPTEPTTPTDTETPVTPTEPTAPAETETPVTPVEPTTPVTPSETETPVNTSETTTPIEVSNDQKSSTTKEEIKKVTPNNSTETAKKDIKTLPNTGDAGSLLSIIGSGLLSLGGYVALKRK